jgi:hypothetical protein
MMEVEVELKLPTRGAFVRFGLSTKNTIDRTLNWALARIHPDKSSLEFVSMGAKMAPNSFRMAVASPLRSTVAKVIEWFWIVTRSRSDASIAGL